LQIQPDFCSLQAKPLFYWEQERWNNQAYNTA